MPNDELAGQWRKFAKMDYDIAVHDKSFHPVPIEIICYHCQQAGEKALKAVLAYHNEEIPRTHDLFRLLELCTVHAPELSDLSAATKQLTDFATVTHYPSMIELEEADMNLALECAGRILNAVMSLW